MTYGCDPDGSASLVRSSKQHQMLDKKQEEAIPRLLRIIGVLVLLVLPLPCSAAPELDHLVIIVPASAGGGFDKTAQSVAKVLQAENIVQTVEIRRSPGAGGLIALAQFEGQASPKPTVLIAGVTTLGAELENHSLVSLTDLEPVCQLTEVALAIGVRDNSPIKSVGDLIGLMRTAPDRVVWVGGSSGSADEVLLWAMARKLGIAHDRFKFIAVSGGGEQVLDRLASGPELVAIRSYEEFASYPRRRNLRLLAISTADRFPGIALPTLRETGFDLVVTDWKGAFVSRSASQDQRRAIDLVFSRLLASAAWSREVAAQNWRSPSNPKVGFQARIAADRERLKGLLSGSAAAAMGNRGFRDLLVGPWRDALLGFVVVSALVGLALVWRRAARIDGDSRKRAVDILRDTGSKSSDDDSEGSNYGNAGEQTAISRQMQTWELSGAEFEIGWMILKGLQFKEIAAARGTSERTVRQQAQAIYAKSGIPNRSEFSAHFLEELRF
jgi:putative tricarboxylic transport membrane protein